MKMDWQLSYQMRRDLRELFVQVHLLALAYLAAYNVPELAIISIVCCLQKGSYLEGCC